MDGTMLECICGTPAVVVSFHRVSRSCAEPIYIQAVVGAAKDIDVLHGCTIRLNFY